MRIIAIFASGGCERVTEPVVRANHEVVVRPVRVVRVGRVARPFREHAYVLRELVFEAEAVVQARARPVGGCSALESSRTSAMRFVIDNSQNMDATFICW